MKTCENCGLEIWTKDGDNMCRKCEDADLNGDRAALRRLRNNANRRARHELMLSMGLVRVRGALGGVYYE